MPKPSRGYLGEIAPNYEFKQPSDQDRKIELDNDFWRDSDTGNFFIFRRQRSIGTVSNARPNSKIAPGFFGKRLGGANKESALKFGSGYVDSLKFENNLLYEVSQDVSSEVVDLRHLKGIPTELFVLHALSKSIGPVLGSERFDSHPAVEGKAIITDRPLLQKLLAPDSGRDSLRQPAAFMHIPFEMHDVALNALAHRNIKQKD